MTSSDRSPPSHPAYRADIDGLRALAILPVLFFHYRIAGFRGGFVGVDVFFVISGYLITQLIAHDCDSGRFSFARFYERRLRRIFPALFAMLAVVSVAAVFILFPVDLVRYANSLLATAAFGSNFEFWREAGYFDVVAEEKPLLHLWSIAVEEQFYLLFPAVILLIPRRGRRIAAVAGIFVASFGLAVWGVVYAPSATFYLLPGRAWELMLGALIALGAFPELRTRAAGEVVAFVGVAMIAAAVVFYTSDTPFPGVAALLPCLGAGLVIHAARAGQNLAGRLLALPPLVTVGRLSYSLYLWHWPVYVFARYLDFRDPGPAKTAMLVALSFGLAALSFLAIEQPFRNGRLKLTRRALFIGGGAVMTASAACAGILLSGDGFPGRLRPDIRVILAEQNDAEPDIDSCFGRPVADVRAGRLCRIGAAGVAPSFILWGDSHADAILPAIAEAAARDGRAGLFAGGRSCPPLLDVTTPRRDCHPFNDAVIALARKPGIRDVILDARWAKYAEGSTYGFEPEGRVVLSDGGSTAGGGNHAVFARSLVRTVKALSGKKVIVVGSVPEIGWPVPAVLARERLAAQTLIPPPDRNAFLARQKFVIATFNRLAQENGVAIVYPDSLLCPSGPCQVSRDGIPLYRDEHHLSVYGARLLEPLIEQVL